MGDCRTPEELYEKLPGISPASANFFEARDIGWATSKKLTGYWAITNMEHLESVPKWDWNLVLQVPAILASGGVEQAAQKSITTGGRLQAVAPTFVPYDPNTITLMHAKDTPWL